MNERADEFYNDGQVRVTRHSVSSQKATHVTSDITGARYEVTTPEKEQIRKRGNVMFLAFGFLFIISIFLIFGWHGDYRLAGFVCLFLAVGGMYLSDHLWDDHPTKKLITIYITTSKGEIPLHMWNWTEPLEGSFDVRWKEQNAHEERCKQIVDAIRRAIEVG